MAGLINASSVTMACSLMSHRASRGLSGKKELALEAEGPVGAELRRGGVHEDLGGEVHRDLAEVDDLAEAAAERNGPDSRDEPAAQLAVMIGDEVKYQPSGKL